jgi:phosphomannomutase
MQLNDPIKTYDARWVDGDFSLDEVKRLFESTLLYSKLLGVDTVTIARDARNSGASIMDLATDLALEAGFIVYVCPEPVSTTQSYFLSLQVSREHPKTLGMTITASHNPVEYIGLKLTVPGVQAIGLDSGPLGGFSKIREIYHSDSQIKTSKRINQENLHLLNLTNEYIDFAMAQTGISEGSFKGLSVVIDSLNGSAGVEIRKALIKAGASVSSFRLIPDGNFPSGAPNPIAKNKMDKAISLAASIDHSIVIGTDGDGDRLVFGDGRGLLQAGIASLPILKADREWISSGSGEPGVLKKVIYDPKVNPLILKEWDKLEILPILFRNGHSQIKDHMKKCDALAAVEESGHFYHRIADSHMTMYGENSLITIFLFLRWVQTHPDELNALWAMQRETYSTGEFNYQFSDNQTRDTVLEDLMSLLESTGSELKTETQEGHSLEGLLAVQGIKQEADAVLMEKEWFSGYFRISTNEKGIIRSFITADSLETGKKIEHQIISLLEKQGKEILE